ncbi:MAG TPA: metallopeptidase TldD-related protein [Candidatus Polarisedimenticolia bacterium]|nr:metallopeptidase TldD-related protein [Candidatus Polarisedimenticolia bacterium]
MKISEFSAKRGNVRFRGKDFARAALCWMLAAQLAGPPIASAGGGKSAAKTAAAGAVNDPVLKAMQNEIARATAELSKSEQPPYYLSYTVYDQDFVVLVGAYGSLLTNSAAQRRFADVTMRVGTPELDNTHGQSRPSGVNSGSLPLGNDADAIGRVLWELTDREYKRAVPTLLNVRTNTAVRAEEEDKSPDFSKEKPQTHVQEAPAAGPFDRAAWEGEIKRLSGAFRKYPEVYFASVMIQVQRSNSRMVSSEGSAIVSPTASTRLIIEAQTRAEDGMDLLRVETFQAPAASGLPSEAELTGKIENMAADLSALRKAPMAEPYDGPAVLSGRAAAVFFHEVLGHRLEGHRQRDEEEGQTFTKKIGQEVLPKFLSVTDDPTTREMGGMKLAGSYDFDNEGEPARRVDVIKDGVLENFLMSRMPVKNFAQSNGHGRNQPGRMPTGRQGNLIVTSTKTVPEGEMRQKLIEEVKKQGKPYGLYFDDIQGGFTLTTRSLPQAFQVLPVIVYKVYADGRPDELVRGVDIVGTPLAALTRIMTTGDQQHVFNGVCGAESGQVPVAAVAPAMLFSEMEVQKRAHEHERPPLLPPPGFEDGSAAKAVQMKAEVKP